MFICFLSSKLMHTNWIRQSWHAIYRTHTHTPHHTECKRTRRPQTALSIPFFCILITEKTMCPSPRTNLFSNCQACFTCTLCLAELLIYMADTSFPFHCIHVKSITFKCRPIIMLDFRPLSFSSRFRIVHNRNEWITDWRCECVDLSKKSCDRIAAEATIVDMMKLWQITRDDSFLREWISRSVESRW